MNRKGAEGEPRRVRKIVVATDFSESTGAVLERAIGFGRMFDASLDLVHVNEPLVYTLTEGYVPTDDRRSESMRRTDERLAALADLVTSAGLPCLTTSLDGLPQSEIVRHAQRTGADLIILGAHGRGSLAHAVLGSVAERVIHRATCPVLVVPNV